MKQPKKLTRTQKEILSSQGLKADEWSLVKEMEFYIQIINKRTGQRKMVDKFKRRR